MSRPGKPPEPGPRSLGINISPEVLASGLGVNLPAVGLAPAGDVPPGPVCFGRHMVFGIDGFRPPSLNELMRGKLVVRMRAGKRSHRIVGDAFRESRLPRASTKRRVSLAIGLGKGRREMDVDGPWKVILDGLKACKAIVDDKVKWCAIGDLEFYRRPAGDFTWIILEDVTEDTNG